MNRLSAEQHALAVRELVRRGKVRRQYTGKIRRREIAMGMNSCELVAAWGWPNDQNRSVNRWGTQTQWIYSYISSSGPTYVYTENQIVTSRQD